MRSSNTLASTIFLAAAWLLFAPGSGAGQDRIDERHDLRPDASVEIRAVSHAVEVERWDRSEIQVAGDYDREWEELDVRASAGSFSLRIDSTRRRGRWTREGPGRLTVRVPEGVRLDLATVSGAVTVRDVHGPVSAESVSGSITVSGSPERVNLASVSGHLEFTGRSESVRASTVSGTLTLDAAAASVEANSVSGGIRIASSAPARAVTLNSVSGRVSYRGPLAPSGSLRAETHSGSVDLELTGEPDATFRLSTFSGRIDHRLDGARDERWVRARFTPEEEVSFVVGQGNARVEASSFSGSVRVRGGNR